MLPTSNYAIQIAASMTPTQRDIFYAEYNRRAKDYGVAMLLAIFLGWNFGIHKFYLGQPIQGVLHILFAVTGIPFILTIFDVFTMHRQVNKVNQRIADETAINVREHVQV